MSTDTIGSGGDFSTLALWAADVVSIGTLTETEIGQCTDDANYTFGATSDLDFSGVTLDGFTITIQGTGSGINDGDLGNGARVVASSNFNLLYQARDLIIEDMSFENTAGDPLAVFGNSFFTGRRIIASCLNGGSQLAVVFGSVSTTAMDLEACRAEAGKIGFQLTNASSNLANCSAINSGTGFDTTVTNTGTIQNNATYGCTTDYNGTWSGTNTNNADEDSSAPGTSSVTITSNPFEADGFTPTISSQLDGAGVDLSISLDCANLSFAATPAIGAYEATAAAAGGGPKGPFTHPFYGPFRGPIS